MNLRSANVLSSSHLLIPGAATEVQAFFRGMERGLDALKVPGLAWRDATVDSGLVSSLAGARQDVLVVTYASASPEYHVILTALPLGTALDAWYITAARARVGRELLRALHPFRARQGEVGSELELLTLIRLRGVLDLTKDLFRQVTTDLRAAAAARLAEVDQLDNSADS